ncbi:hypothetical protein NC651_025980 [Populus alba x Populus x berolinensis]|nr:hypothetical protein NC651_025980 [Populus alba x Populus x berolinensis]
MEHVVCLEGIMVLSLFFQESLTQLLFITPPALTPLLTPSPRLPLPTSFGVDRDLKSTCVRRLIKSQKQELPQLSRETFIVIFCQMLLASDPGKSGISTSQEPWQMGTRIKFEVIVSIKT